MTDTIARLTHLQDTPQTQATRQQRAKAISATQACEDLLLAPDLPGGLPLAQRLAVAQTVSAASGVTALGEHYAAQLQRLPTATPDARWQAMHHFTQLLATQPAAADRAALLALPQAGHFLLQPVHVDDVAAGLAALATNRQTEAVAFTGSQCCTLAGYLNLLRRNLHGKNPARMVCIPRPLVETAALLAKYPSRGMLSRDSLKLLDEGSAADCAAFAALLGRTPWAAEEFGRRHP